ncbi:MAG TPA: PA14 domain-containing protein [Planctomycetota bacterium]|nr:PA14 domain-containing protein [Planctomycetota bacterium]
MHRIVTAVVIVILLLVLGGVLLYVDHERSRPDRIDATRLVDEMISVRDQVLRFQDEYGGLPESLDDLVGRYVRADQLAAEGKPLYAYDPAGRELRQLQGPLVHGLWTRRRSPVTMALPPADPSVAGRLEAEMLTVRDALLDYERKHGALPRTLGELVGRFLRPDRLVRDGNALYGYEPEKRRLTRLPGREFSPTPSPVVVIPATDEGTSSGGDGPSRTSADDTTDLHADGVAVLPRGPELPEAPPGAMVFEAEHFTEMNWGWDVLPDASASGGAYLHSWEGITNGPAQVSYGVFDFFDIRPKNEYTVLRYHFRVPTSGEYYVYARMWTTDTHCSNSVCAAIDRGGPDVGSMGNRLPFQWLWTSLERDGVYLKEGDHFLHIFIHEDGIRLDQFIVSPTPVMGGKAYRSNMLPGRGTAWEKEKGPAVRVLFDLRSQVMSPESPPDCRVVLRRLRAASGEAVLRVTLEDAGLGGRDWRVADHKVDLARLPEVCLVPLSFAGLDMAGLERREYLLRAELVSNGETLASTRVTLLRPFVWEACGPYPFMSTSYRGPLDADDELSPDDKRTWTPVKLSSMDHFGVLDFGVHTNGSSLHAPQDKTVYARTRFHVPTDGAYVFLIQSDDHMLLWLDGKLVYRFEDRDYFPVTRSAKRHRLQLTAGEHRLRMRVNQTHTRWQACVRIRTADDGISNVVGLPGPSNDTPK